MEIKVYLREADGDSQSWVDISERCVRPSIELSEGFSTSGKTGDATSLSLTIKALSVTDAAAFHTTEKLVRLVIDDVLVFEGYSDGEATVDLGTTTEWVHVDINFNSYMELLKEQAAPEGGIAYEGMKIFDPSDKESSLVHLLAEQMYDLLPDPYHDLFTGISEKVITPTSYSAITKTLPIVYIPEGETIYDVFQTLLYENGLSFYYKDKAIHVLQPWNTEAAVRDVLLTDFISNPTLKQQPLKHRSHLVLSVAEYTEESNSTLYDSGDPNSDDSNAQVIEPGESYPEDGEPLDLPYGKAEDEDLEIVYSVNPTLDYTCVQVDDAAEDYEDWGTDPAPVTVDADIKPTEGTVLFTNPNVYRIGIQRYRVIADRAYWKKYTTTVKDSIKEGEEEEYEADYLPDSESAVAFLELYHLQEYANNAEVVLETERIELTPGELIQVTELPYRLLVLTKQTTFDNPFQELYRYSLIPLVYIETPTDITHSGSGSSGGVLRYIYLEASAIYYHYDSDGNLAPEDQMIYINLRRVNVTSTPEWLINGEAAEPVEGNVDRLKVGPEYMEGRTIISVDVYCGKYSTGITIVKVQDGSGGQPIQLFQWSSSWQYHPDEDYDVITWGEIAITMRNWALVTNTGVNAWELEIPPQPEGKYYLWCKFWNYNTGEWNYYCMTGSPAVDFSVVISPETYRLTSRGYTKEGQTITVTVTRINTNGTVGWDIPDDVEWDYADDSVNGDKVVITIPRMISLPNFTFSVSIAVIGLTKSYTVSGIQEGEEEPMYMGIYYDLDSLPTETTEGPVIYGDHILVEDSDGNRTPYYWNGTQWVMADSNTPDDLVFLILQNVLYHATQSPGTVASQSVVNLFAQNFAAYHAFIYSLMVRNLLVGSGTSSSGFRFEVYDYQDGENVTPVIRAIYDGRTVFQIDPTTGNVFLGEPNASLTAPSTGFMYRASDQSIVSANEYVKIDASGKITAVDAEFDSAYMVGMTAINAQIAGLVATEAKITGEFYAATLEAYGGSTGYTGYTCAASISGVLSLFNTLRNLGYALETFIKCQVSTSDRTDLYIMLVEYSGTVGILQNLTSYMITFYSSSDGQTYSVVSPSDIGIDTATSGSNYQEPNYPCLNYQIYSGSWGGTGGCYPTEAFTLSLLSGGDVLKFLNIPSSAAGLETGQVYQDNGTLKIVL